MWIRLSLKHGQLLICGKYVFLLGGRFFPVGKLPKCDHFVEMADISQAVIGKDFYLPVRIIRIERRRTTPLKKELTKEEIREQAEKNYKKYDKKLQENGIQILHKSVMIDDSGKMVHVTGKLDVLIRQQQYLITPADETEKGKGPDGINTANDRYSD